MLSRRVFSLLLAALAATPVLSRAAEPQSLPPVEEARKLVDTFLNAELARLNKGEMAMPDDIKAVCTVPLRHLLAIEIARGKAYSEGFADAKGDPSHLGKPIFADSGFFVNATLEGEMSLATGTPEKRGSHMAVPVKFTSREGGKAYDQGSQVVILAVENGAWRIDDVESSGDFSLVELLRRPKYMDLPEKKKP